MFFRCCLINITIITLRYILYLVYLCPSQGLGLFMLYLCDLFFSFSLIFNVINHTTLLNQTHLLFIYFQNISYYFWMKKTNNVRIVKDQPQGVAQILLNFLPISAWPGLWAVTHDIYKINFSAEQYLNVSPVVNKAKSLVETTIPHINSETNLPHLIINVDCKYLRKFLGASFDVATLSICCNIEQGEGPDLFLQSGPFQDFHNFFKELSWSH